MTPFLTSAPGRISAPAAFSLVALGALGTGLAYILNYGIIRAAGATVATTVTYLIPVFSTLAGVVLLREPLAWNQPIGALVVILGVAVSQGRLRRRAQATPGPA